MSDSRVRPRFGRRRGSKINCQMALQVVPLPCTTTIRDARVSSTANDENLQHFDIAKTHVNHDQFHTCKMSQARTTNRDSSFEQFLTS